jgi:hypothetical protein
MVNKAVSELPATRAAGVLMLSKKETAVPEWSAMLPAPRNKAATTCSVVVEANAVGDAVLTRVGARRGAALVATKAANVMFNNLLLVGMLVQLGGCLSQTGVNKL